MGGSVKSLIVAGQGIRLGGEISEFRKAAEKYPVVTTWLGADLLPTDHPNNIGIIGPCGHQGANRALHEAWEFMVWGASMSVAQLGAFSPHGRSVDHFQAPHPTKWAKRESVPLIGSYAFNDRMTRALPAGTVMVVDGGGTALYTGFQSSYIKEGSRLICSSSMSAMGSGLPEAVGACFANGRKLTTCIIGDGSLMLNVQELQTISTHCLPIKIFVLNNGGYLAIRHTQRDFQDGRYYGVGGDDLEFAQVEMQAHTYGIQYFTEEHYKDAIEWTGPALCEVMCDQNQPMLRQGFKDGQALPLTEMVLA